MPEIIEEDKPVELTPEQIEVQRVIAKEAIVAARKKEEEKIASIETRLGELEARVFFLENKI